jgi:erythronate-4-phosphate dehydrogenase
MSLRILADENIPAVEHYLGTAGHVERANGRTLDRSQLENIDVLLVRSVTRVDEALLSGSAVRFVGTATSGFDHIDREYLEQRAIDFVYAPGSNANSVVEYVLAAVAAVDTKLEQLLAGGVVGIVGYGNVGKAVAARFGSLGIAYRVYDPWLDQRQVARAATLDEVLDCDVITLHPELTLEQPWPSHHLLGADELARLRPDSLLINASRGAVIDNAALLACLTSGRAFFTVLDVWEGEPNVNSALLERVVIGTAHIAGYSLDGKLLATRMLSEAVAASRQLSSPPSDSPAGPAGELVVPDALSRAELIRFLIHSRYDIFHDDTLLRQAVLAERAVPGAGQRFDQLRKLYRERRELAGSLVKGALLLPGHIETVRALGCIAANDRTSE